MAKKKWMYNLLIVCATELALFLLGLSVIGQLFYGAVYPLLAEMADAQLYEFCYWAGYTVLFLLPSAALLLYIRQTGRAVLASFSLKAGAGRALVIGSLAGAGLNWLCALLAAANGSYALRFSTFTPLVVPPLLFCFFTCSCEELFCRGYVLEFLKKRYALEVAAAAGSVLFIFHHIGNMMGYGFSPLFALNVFLIGLVFVLIAEVTGSIWAAFGMHTLWNYNQQFILGLPNSGTSSSLSLLAADGAVSGFFFDSVYGLEGAPGTTLVILAALAVLLALYRRRESAARG